ncbi:MAG: hypothetical protein ACTSRT_15245 [Promethearchaeota archaeon]
MPRWRSRDPGPAKPGNAPDLSEYPIQVKLKIWVPGNPMAIRIGSGSSNPLLGIFNFLNLYYSL